MAGADADAQQAALDEIRDVFAELRDDPGSQGGHRALGGDPAWTTVRPPLVSLTPAQAADLVGKLENKDFQMPGLSGR